MFKELRNIIYDQNLKIIIMKNKININNYEKILMLENDKILISSKEGNIKILGNNLAINRVQQDELLIIGNIKNVELG